MDIFETIQERRSVRSYADKKVEDEKIEKVLEAATSAPSANNRQEWRFIVVRDNELRTKLIEAAHGQRFVGEAPVVIVACAAESDHIMSCGHPAHLIDVAIAVDHLTLAARALGLGTCWVGAFDANAVRSILGIPDDIEVVQLIPMGYPADWPASRSRRPMDNLVHYDRWE